MYTRKDMSDARYYCKPKTNCIQRSTNRKTQPVRLMRFTTLSIRYQYLIKPQHQISYNNQNHFAMTRGNQRQIDRERARKRNGDKNSDKKEGKSDFFKNKDSNAQIMRQKQKKFEGEHDPEPEQKSEKKQKHYKKEEQ